MIPKGSINGHIEIVAAVQFDIVENVILAIVGTQPTPAGAQLRLSDIQYDVTNMVDLKIETALIGIVGGFDVGTAIEVRGMTR